MKHLPDRMNEMASIEIGESTLLDYYLAVSSDEEKPDTAQALDWYDKPHRLVYDLVKHILDNQPR